MYDCVTNRTHPVYHLHACDKALKGCATFRALRKSNSDDDDDDDFDFG